MQNNKTQNNTMRQNRQNNGANSSWEVAVNTRFKKGRVVNMNSNESLIEKMNKEQDLNFPKIKTKSDSEPMKKIKTSDTWNNKEKTQKIYEDTVSNSLKIDINEDIKEDIKEDTKQDTWDEYEIITAENVTKITCDFMDITESTIVITDPETGLRKKVPCRIYENKYKHPDRKNYRLVVILDTPDESRNKIRKVKSVERMFPGPRYNYNYSTYYDTDNSDNVNYGNGYGSDYGRESLTDNDGYLESGDAHNEYSSDDSSDK
jgi:hypothetical protein